jgi:catechol 2,3-dioxygenase-like lactoylglutathione lyase family enzyme
MLERIDHLLLAMPAGEEAKIRAFCVGVLGLEEIAKPESLRGRGGVWFGLGDGTQLHYGVEAGFAPARKAHPAFAVGALDALAGRLEAAGYPVKWDDALTPRRRFYCADPFGNRLEFLGPVV